MNMRLYGPMDAVIKSYKKRKNAEWDYGVEGLIKLGEDIEETYGVPESDLQIEIVRVADKDITCKTLISTEKGDTSKFYIAPDVIPVGGLVKIENRGEVLMKLVDFHYGKNVEKEKMID